MLPLAACEGLGALGLKGLLLGKWLHESFENSFQVSLPASFSQPSHSKDNLQNLQLCPHGSERHPPPFTGACAGAKAPAPRAPSWLFPHSLRAAYAPGFLCSPSQPFQLNVSE